MRVKSDAQNWENCYTFVLISKGIKIIESK